MILTFILLLFSLAMVPKPRPHPAYKVLKEYGFLLNLIPTGATSYNLNKHTGEFEVNMGSNTCKLTVHGYNLMFKSTISGVITRKKLRKLKGVSVMVNFFWVDVREVTNDGARMNVSAGTLPMEYPAEEEKVENLPNCGCGFGCKGLDFIQEKLKMLNMTKLLNWSL